MKKTNPGTSWERLYRLVLLSLLVSATGCHNPLPAGISLLPEAAFTDTLGGKPVRLYTLKNNQGLVAQITNYGGRVVSLWVPDKNGALEDIVLGYDSLQGYLRSHESYYGALIGRVANRIAAGRFTLDDHSYQLALNNGVNTLHGGRRGYNDVVWDVRQAGAQHLELHYLSPDGEEHFPGNLDITVRYALTDSNELRIEYTATTDKATPVNLTHHSFFNLHGAGKGTINDHILQIDADYYTPVDSTLIPSGEIAPVAGTPMDFTQPVPIGQRVDALFSQLRYGLGYDHNWVLRDTGKGLRQAASISEPVSGRVMEVWTDEPGLQFYGGNFLDGRDRGKGGLSYNHRTAFCLETQHFPDSPNQPAFPSVVLRPGAAYHSVCSYRFGITGKN